MPDKNKVATGAIEIPVVNEGVFDPKYIVL